MRALAEWREKNKKIRYTHYYSYVTHKVRKGKLNMIRYKNKGYTIEIALPEETGYKDYSVECTYHFDKKKNKYSLTMYLVRNDIGDKLQISSQEIDTQYISGTKETIKENICRVVEQACVYGFFTYYIERYEYTVKCFERGNELFEVENLNVVQI